MIEAVLTFYLVLQKWCAFNLKIRMRLSIVTQPESINSPRGALSLCRFISMTTTVEVLILNILSLNIEYYQVNKFYSQLSDGWVCSMSTLWVASVYRCCVCWQTGLTVCTDTCAWLCRVVCSERKIVLKCRQARSQQFNERWVFVIVLWAASKPCHLGRNKFLAFLLLWFWGKRSATPSTASPHRLILMRRWQQTWTVATCKSN